MFRSCLVLGDQRRGILNSGVGSGQMGDPSFVCHAARLVSLLSAVRVPSMEIVRIRARPSLIMIHPPHQACWNPAAGLRGFESLPSTPIRDTRAAEANIRGRDAVMPARESTRDWPLGKIVGEE